MEPVRKLWNQPGSYGTSQEVMEPARKLWNQSGSYGTSQEVMELARKLWNQPGSYGTSQEVMEPARKLWNQPGSYGTSLVPSLVPGLSPQKTGRAWDRGYLVRHGNFAPAKLLVRGTKIPGITVHRTLNFVFAEIWSGLGYWAGLGILVRGPELRFLILSFLPCSTMCDVFFRLPGLLRGSETD